MTESDLLENQPSFHSVTSDKRLMIASLRSHFLLSDQRDPGRLQDVFFRYKAEVQSRCFPKT